MRWAWTGMRLGKRVPLAQVTVTHTIDMDDVAQALCVWAVGEVLYELQEGRADLPDLKTSKINEIVRRTLEESGSRVFESFWSDDLNVRQTDAVLTWSREQCRKAWPRRCAESWGVES